MYVLVLAGCPSDDGKAPPPVRDDDVDGYPAIVDCDDTDPRINPGATERCDGIDNNCDGVVDDDAMDASLFYRDGDADGFGNSDDALAACSQPTGYVQDNTDCEDMNADVYPGAPEQCDGLDNECDGVLDEDAVDTVPFYRDADADGFGNPDEAVSACNPPSGYVGDKTDCDDTDAQVNPDQIEVCDALGTDEDLSLIHI